MFGGASKAATEKKALAVDVTGMPSMRIQGAPAVLNLEDALVPLPASSAL
jgi:hypothetical protein